MAGQVCKVLAGVALVMMAYPAAAEMTVKNMKGGSREITIDSKVEQQSGWRYIAMVKLEHAKKAEPAKASFSVLRVDPPASYSSEPWPWRLCPPLKLLVADQEVKGVEQFPPQFDYTHGDNRESIYWIEVDRDDFEKAALARDISLQVCNDVIPLPARFQLDMRKAIDLYRLR